MFWNWGRNTACFISFLYSVVQILYIYDFIKYLCTTHKYLIIKYWKIIFFPFLQSTSTYIIENALQDTSVCIILAHIMHAYHLHTLILLHFCIKKYLLKIINTEVICFLVESWEKNLISFCRFYRRYFVSPVERKCISGMKYVSNFNESIM